LLLPDWFNASELALYYGEYARLHKKNIRFDSLLYLSTLTPEQLDSVITKIQEQKKEELEALKKQQEKENSTLNVINTNPNANQNQQDETNQKQNGFLNHKNPNSVQQSKDQFMALWGNRPLVDNWRFASLVKNVTVTDQNSSQSGKNTASKDNAKSQQLQALKIDLSEIPIDSAKRVTFLNDFASNLYQTGNVFFLNLNEPDSAKRYYTRIIKEFSGTKVYEQAQFTLSELLFANNDSVSAREMAYQLYSKNPQSSFSTVLVDRYGFESTSISDSTFTDPVTELLDIIYSNVDTVTHVHKAESLKKLASFTTDKELASGYLQQAAFFYMQNAVSDTSFQRKRHNYETSQLEWKQKEKEFAQFKDSIRTMMKDSTVQADSIKMLTYKKLSDSTLKQPDFSPLFPYLGQVWDSSRSILSVIKSSYASTTAGKNMELLRAEIELPLALKPKAEPKKQASDSTAQIVKTDSLGFSLPKDSLQLSSPKKDSSFQQPQTPKKDSNLPEREQGQ
jgi:tetratricopeptide (TPR) repeat protein